MPGLWTIPHTAPGGWLVGGPSNAGGLFLNWATALGGDGDDAVDPDRRAGVAALRAGRADAPARRTTAGPCIAGLDLTHGPGALRRAAYEAAGFACRHHIDLAGRRRAPASSRPAAARTSTEWMQALADCTGLPVDVVAVPEGAALGAAFIARMALGLESAMHEAASLGPHRRARVEPRRRLGRRLREPVRPVPRTLHGHVVV